MKNRMFLLSIVLFLPITVNAIGNFKAGRELAGACVACHGPDGNATAPQWPKIAGQNAKYLIKQLKDFKLGEEGPRYEPVMSSFMAGYSDQAIEDLAAYYAKQTVSKGYAQAKWVKRGQQLYRGGDYKLGVPACSACHGPRGRGNLDSGFPLLSGQYADYTVSQLNLYADGKRRNDVHGIMQTIAKRLSESDRRAVASYIEGLY